MILRCSMAAIRVKKVLIFNKLAWQPGRRLDLGSPSKAIPVIVLKPLFW